MADDDQDDPTAEEEDTDSLDDGLRKFYSFQAEVMLAQYENINHLLGPTDDWTGPGTHCEILLREFLRRNLPSSLSADKGFVYGRREVEGVSKHCPEIDILIHDNSLFRPVVRIDDFVIVQPEAVKAVIQVKRTLTASTLPKALENIVEAKQHIRDCGRPGALQGVFSGAVFFEDAIEKPATKSISDTYQNAILSHFQEPVDGWTMPDYVGSLKHLSLFLASQLTYRAYESIHNGSNLGIQGFLSRLSTSILPLGTHPRFAFPSNWVNVHQFTCNSEQQDSDDHRTGDG